VYLSGSRATTIGFQVPKIEVIENILRSGYDLTELDWVPWEEPGRVGVERYVLWAPQGVEEDSIGLLLRYPSGAHGDFHEHLGYELMLVLDGRLDHSDGRSFSKGDLVVEAPGTRHQISSSTGCTVLAIRTKPVAPCVPEIGEAAASRQP
jgi:anti-sigma factor ChrR (cupin superfamily)